MAARHAVTAQDLLSPGHFNVFSFGAFLGFEWTPAQQVEANFYARRFFEDLALIPTVDDIVFCERIVGGAGPSGQGGVCGAVMRPKLATERKLGFRWRCRGEGNRRHPDTYLEPTTGTIYFKSHLEFRKMLKLMYSWLHGAPVTKAAHECSMAKETACTWFQWWRESLAVVAWHDYAKIGGPGDIVEIDETHLFTRKNNVGRVLNRFWVFGGVSRTTGQRFAMRVAMRNAVTLGAEILDNIAAGSFICTDGWAAYNNIADLPAGSNARFYRGHGVVIHQTNFVNPPRTDDPFWLHGFNVECEDRLFNGPPPAPDPILGPAQPIRYHIQRCERSWRDLKRKVKSTRELSNIDSYIGEYMYKHNVLGRVGPDLGAQFRQVFQDISRVYPGPNVRPIRANKPGFRMFPIGNLNVALCECDECDV